MIYQHANGTVSASTEVECPDCGAEMTSKQLLDHQAQDCAQRLARLLTEGKMVKG